MKPPCLPRSEREILKVTRAMNRLIHNYILRADGRVRPASFMHWAWWNESGKGRVALSYPLGEDSETHISTIFLGQDANMFNLVAKRTGQKPTRRLLFETMVFGGSFDGHQIRYSTLDEALLGHLEITERIKSFMPTEEHGT